MPCLSINVVASLLVINNIHLHKLERRGNRNAFRVLGEACGFYLMCPEHLSEGLDKPSLMRLLLAQLRLPTVVTRDLVRRSVPSLRSSLPGDGQSCRQWEVWRKIWGSSYVEKNPLSRDMIFSTSLRGPPPRCVPWRGAVKWPCVVT